MEKKHYRFRKWWIFHWDNKQSPLNKPMSSFFEDWDTFSIKFKRGLVKEMTVYRIQQQQKNVGDIIGIMEHDWDLSCGNSWDDTRDTLAASIPLYYTIDYPTNRFRVWVIVIVGIILGILVL